MRLRNTMLQRLPPHLLPTLLTERTVGVIASVRKKMGTGFVIVPPRANELLVTIGDGVHLTVGVAIRFYGCGAAHLQPIIGLRFAVQKVEHHLFVIAEKRNQMAALTQRDQLLNHTATVGPPVDTVSKH